MNDALMYFLKVNIAIALFYLFYRLVFYNDTFWATRRFYLVVSILLSVVYPLISFSGWLEKQQPMQVMMSGYVQLNEITITNAPVHHFKMENILLIIYGLVSILLLIRMFIQLTSILRWRMKGKTQILQDIKIIAIDATINPFSFFSMIFINPGLHDEQETRQILTHESTHARQLHSLDVLLSELMTVLFWINPAAWLLKREIRHNLEFLADNSVLKSGIDSKNYQYHLLQLSCQIPENQLINKFNILPLKKRITMMNQQKTKKAGILKYSLIVPLVLALMLSSNAETLISSANKLISSDNQPANSDNNLIVSDNRPANSDNNLINSENQTPNSDNKVISSNDTIKTPANGQPDSQKPDTKSSFKYTQVLIRKDGDTLQGKDNQTILATTVMDVDTLKEKLYSVVEKMPQYPEGENALMHYIASNLRYPVIAQENGIQGKVIIRFVVNSKGKVSNPVVVRTIRVKTKKLEEVVVVGYGAKKAVKDKGPEQKQIKPGTDMKILEKEAMRIINILPDFTPGEQNGKKVAVYYTLPITFKLE